jgi:type IV pilus assembly protein PilE
MMPPEEESMNMKRGFTLIEMLVVLVILSIVAGMAYPSYSRHVARARRTEGQIDLIETMQQQERYYQQHNSYIAFTSADADAAANAAAQGLRWWSGASAAVSVYELDAHACPGRDLADCVEVRATPGTAKVDSRFRDPECGALTLDSYGVHASEGTGRCWP